MDRPAVPEAKLNVRRLRRLTLALAAIALFLASARSAAAQNSPDSTARLPRAITLRTDNDAFDFWQPPWDRPDEDYTSGVRIVYENSWKPWWATRLWTRDPACRGATVPCVTSSSWIGQDMYTPERNDDESFKTVGARPSAGWLYYGEEQRRVAADRADLFDLTIGVTGPPSLAQFTQKLAHAFAPAFNAPIDWRHQLPFEPGVIATYEHRELLTIGAAGPVALQLIPSASATAGNVLTQGSAQVEARFGIDLRNPWLPPSSGDEPELAATASLAGNAVAYDLFQDRSAARGVAPVGHERFYAEHALGLSLLYHALSIGYRAVFDGRMYAAGRPHAYASLTAGWVFRR